MDTVLWMHAFRFSGMTRRQTSQVLYPKGTTQSSPPPPCLLLIRGNVKALGVDDMELHCTWQIGRRGERGHRYFNTVRGNGCPPPHPTPSTAHPREDILSKLFSFICCYLLLASGRINARFRGSVCLLFLNYLLSFSPGFVLTSRYCEGVEMWLRQHTFEWTCACIHVLHVTKYNLPV